MAAAVTARSPWPIPNPKILKICVGIGRNVIAFCPYHMRTDRSLDWRIKEERLKVLCFLDEAVLNNYVEKCYL